MSEATASTPLTQFIASHQAPLPGLGEVYQFGRGLPYEVGDYLDQLTEPAALNDGIRQLIEGLNVPDVFVACRCAIMMGALVERGGDPSLGFPAVLDRLETLMPLWQRTSQLLEHHCGIQHISALTEAMLDVMARVDLDCVKMVLGAPCIVPAAMAMLARVPANRDTARARGALMETLGELAGRDHHAFFLEETLSAVDDMPLLVLHLDQKRGVKVRLDFVRNNFHLFSLIQTVLVSEGVFTGKEPNRDLMDLATGSSLHAAETITHDDAGFDYLNWTAIQADATIDRTNQVQGELSPAALFKYEETPVLLLSDLQTPRQWDAGFFRPYHEYLRSGIRIEKQLTSQDVGDWLTRLRA